MRFFPDFASASKAALLLGWVLGASNALRAESEWTVEPATVVAGRTFSVWLKPTAPLGGATARWNGRNAPFYKMSGGRWRALLGTGSLEPAGTRTVTVDGYWARGGPFLEDVPFAVEEGTYPVGRIKLSPDRDALFTTGSVERDSYVLTTLYNQAPSPKRLWNGAFVRPSTGVVSSVFGARRSYGDRPALNPHTGLDLAAPSGTPVTAPQRGVVVFAGRIESFGNTVLLDHGQGVYTYYLHMRALAVRAGDRVKTGRLLGETGAEGIATGPHVHWSLTVQGERVDPQDWVDRFIP